MNTGKTPQATKVSLLAACETYVSRRIDNAQQAIASARDAAVDDTKSSAGDKFETTREMMQQELNRHQQLLADAQRMARALEDLDIRIHMGTAKLGSLVETSHGVFFIAISAGQLEVEGVTFRVISPASPLARQFIGLKAGQQVTFHGITYQITGIS